MGKIQDFSIKLDGSPKYYTVSEDGVLSVSGQIILILSEAVQVNYLKLKFLGMSHCSWEEETLYNNTTYSSSDQLFKEKREFIKSEETSPTLLSPGMHTYPFHFEIASTRHLPSSYTYSDIGKIYYELSAKMDRSDALFDDRIVLPIKLWNPGKANLSAEMRPVEGEEEYTDCCLCCASGPVVVNATFDKTALRLGSDDTIDISFVVTNMKSDSITLKVHISEYTTFTADSDTIHRSKSVLQAETKPIMARTRSMRMPFKVGPVPESVCGDINTTANIKVAYRIAITIDDSGFELYQPITIAVGKQDASPDTSQQAVPGRAFQPYSY